MATGDFTEETNGRSDFGGYIIYFYGSFKRNEKDMSEKTEQKTLVSWFNYQYKPYKIIAIPNAQKFLGKSKNIFSMINSLVAEGFVKGTCDLFIAKPVGDYAGMWLEMKDKDKEYKHVEENQRIFIQDMLDSGYYATWAAGFKNAQRVVKNYMDGLL